MKKNAAAKHQKRGVARAAASPGPSSVRSTSSGGTMDRLRQPPRREHHRRQEEEPGAHAEARHRPAPPHPVDQQRGERPEEEDAEPHPRERHAVHRAPRGGEPAAQDDQLGDAAQESRAHPCHAAEPQEEAQRRIGGGREGDASAEDHRARQHDRTLAKPPHEGVHDRPHQPHHEVVRREDGRRQASQAAQLAGDREEKDGKAVRQPLREHDRDEGAGESPPARLPGRRQPRTGDHAWQDALGGSAPSSGAPGDAANRGPIRADSVSPRGSRRARPRASDGPRSTGAGSSPASGARGAG